MHLNRHMLRTFAVSFEQDQDKYTPAGCCLLATCKHWPRSCVRFCSFLMAACPSRGAAPFTRNISSYFLYVGTFFCCLHAFFPFAVLLLPLLLSSFLCAHSILLCALKLFWYWGFKHATACRPNQPVLPFCQLACGSVDPTSQSASQLACPLTLLLLL